MAILLIAAGFFVLAYKARTPAAPLAASSSPAPAATTSVSLEIRPALVEQGDPAEVVISGLSDPSLVRSITLNNKKLEAFRSGDHVAALAGISLKTTPGAYPVAVSLASGDTYKTTLVVRRRPVTTAPLGIPAALGGNTATSVANLVTNLADENKVISSVPTAEIPLWSGLFGYPVADPVVTDIYGYTRETVGTTISHVGTDFHAPTGTPVLAMQDGVVRVSQYFTAYGNTVIIDHGVGVQTLYMHLSAVYVKPGDFVRKGATLGLSGETGYAEGPHLHVSVKVNGVSIDPIAFLKLFGSL